MLLYLISSFHAVPLPSLQLRPHGFIYSHLFPLLPQLWTSYWQNIMLSTHRLELVSWVLSGCHVKWYFNHPVQNCATEGLFLVESRYQSVRSVTSISCVTTIIYLIFFSLLNRYNLQESFLLAITEWKFWFQSFLTNHIMNSVLNRHDSRSLHGPRGGGVICFSSNPTDLKK